MTIAPVSRAAVFVAAAAIIVALNGCERRIIRKEERPFMDYAEQNWRRLSPSQKADYYEMVEKQKERACREREGDAQRKGAQ